MIYTKKGDGGTTSLVDGRRVKKCDLRVEAYGTVDELNSLLGLLAEEVLPIDEACYKQMKTIQNRLFVIQTLLATEQEETYRQLPQLDDDAAAELEAWIDHADAQLPKLKAFVIPGGSHASALGHVVRTVCRRAERCIVRLNENEKIAENIKKYINRLSDYLFVISRLLVHLEQKEENFWSAE